MGGGDRGIDKFELGNGNFRDDRNRPAVTTACASAETFGDFGYTMKARYGGGAHLRADHLALHRMLVQGWKPCMCGQTGTSRMLRPLREFPEQPSTRGMGQLSGTGIEQVSRAGEDVSAQGTIGHPGLGSRGGLAAGEKFIEAAQFMSHLANIGDAKTLIIHPASTHPSPAVGGGAGQRRVTPDMIRLSVGIENVADDPLGSGPGAGGVAEVDAARRRREGDRRSAVRPWATGRTVTLTDRRIVLVAGENRREIPLRASHPSARDSQAQRLAGAAWGGDFALVPCRSPSPPAAGNRGQFTGSGSSRMNDQLPEGEAYGRYVYPPAGLVAGADAPLIGIRCLEALRRRGGRNRTGACHPPAESSRRGAREARVAGVRRRSRARARALTSGRSARWRDCVHGSKPTFW